MIRTDRLWVMEGYPINRWRPNSSVGHLPLALVGGTAAVSSWNGVHVPGFSHLFYLGLCVTALVCVGFRRFPSQGALPPLLLLGSLALAVAALIDVVVPIPPSFSAQFYDIAARAGQDISTTVTSAGSNLGNLLRLEAGCLLFPALIAATCKSPRSIRFVATCYVAGTTMSAVVALAGVVSGPAVGGAFTGTASSIAHSGRQFGLTAQPNHLALSSVIAIPFAVSWLARDARIWRCASVVAVALLGVATFASGSRGALIVLIPAFLGTLYLVRELRRYAAPALQLAVLGVFALLASGDLGVSIFRSATTAATSDSIRALVLQLAVREAEARPITGVGFGALEAAHVIYVEILAAGGILGLIGFLALAGSFLTRGWEAAISERSDYAVAPAVAFTVWLVVGCVENQVTDGYLYVSAGLIVATSDVLRRHLKSAAGRRSSLASLSLARPAQESGRGFASSYWQSP